MISNHILLVDDEDSYLKVLAFDLKNHGYQISTADSGPEALTQLEKTDVDMVITDLNMAEMNGIELIREIKKNGLPLKQFS